jgi:adenosylcobinamide-phosphate synthase
VEPVSITLAFFLDMLLGEPRFLPHPVRFMGALTAFLDKRLLSGKKYADLASGLFIVLTVTLAAYFCTFYILKAVHFWFGTAGYMAAGVFLAYTTISAKGLSVAAREVMGPLEKGDIALARRMLSMVVGRDTGELGGQEVARGAVETVAENTSDGVIAPLFYLLIGGPPLAMAYKAINTMDSMIGYRNERYNHLGRAAARLDDIANFIPARLTALLYVAASFFLSGDGRYSWTGAWKVLVRDRKKHSSPNSGYPESAMAGALGVRLGGENSYFGRKSVKPFIGDPDNELTAASIRDSIRLMYAASTLGLAVSVVISAIIYRGLY